MMRVMTRALILLMLSLTLPGAAVQADDGQNKGDIRSSVTVNGDMKVNVVASGPSELEVKATGPSRVWICTGSECQLQVVAETPAEVNIQRNCESMIDLGKPGFTVEIIPGVLKVQGFSNRGHESSSTAGRLVVYLLGSRYEL